MAVRDIIYKCIIKSCFTVKFLLSGFNVYTLFSGIFPEKPGKVHKARANVMRRSWNVFAFCFIPCSYCSHLALVHWPHCTCCRL